jgi:hypothetical protein
MWTVPRVFHICICSPETSAWNAIFLHLHCKSIGSRGRRLLDGIRYFSRPRTRLKKCLSTSLHITDISQPRNWSIVSTLTETRWASSYQTSILRLTGTTFERCTLNFLRQRFSIPYPRWNFVDPEDMLEGLKDTFTSYLLSNFLWRVQIGFFVPSPRSDGEGVLWSDDEIPQGQVLDASIRRSTG